MPCDGIATKKIRVGKYGLYLPRSNKKNRDSPWEVGNLTLCSNNRHFRSEPRTERHRELVRA